MARKLHLVPIIHESPTGLITRKIKKELAVKFPNRDKVFSKSLMKHLNSVFDSLKNEPMDAIFYESTFRSYDINKIKFRQPSLNRILEFAKEKGLEWRKTEDKAYWRSVYWSSEISIFFGRHFGKLVYNPLINSIRKKSEDIMQKRRDYNIAKNVSRGLKEGETGILFYGIAHHPENYIKMLSPDIELTSHPQRYLYITKDHPLILKS